MGHGGWSDAAYVDRERDRSSKASSTGKSIDDVTFAHTAAVRSGKAAPTAKRLDPKGMKHRESRDSKEHPNSTPVVVVLDVTGSMARVVRTIQANLPKLMKLLVDKGYLEDPQVLMSAIGDAYCDRAPLQVGQFESDIKIDDDITSMYLESGGGGQNTESYELMAYVGARMTSTDAWEKRKKKGYFFFIGDELLYSEVNRGQIISLIGDHTNIEKDVPTKQIFQELAEKYHVFFILPVNASNGRDNNIMKHWSNLVGKDHMLTLQDEAGISELIGAQIGLVEGTTDTDTVADDLKAAGADDKTTAMVLRSVSKAYTGGGSISKVDPGAAPSSGDPAVERF